MEKGNIHRYAMPENFHFDKKITHSLINVKAKRERNKKRVVENGNEFYGNCCIGRIEEVGQGCERFFC